MRESSPVSFLLGVALGFIAHPIIMGCVSSKPEPAPHKPLQQTLREVPPPSPLVHPVPTQPLQPHQPVISVPRPTVTYGDRERNELKVKNLRDKLETTITASEQVLQDEARLAVRFHREGHKASARILLRRRQLTRTKIQNCQTMLCTVLEMIDSMDTARDNAKFVESVESGTRAINDVMQGLSLDSVHKALGDARQAEEYTREIGKAMEGETEAMDDEEFERVVAEMTERYGVEEEQAHAKETVIAQEGLPETPAAPEAAAAVQPVPENPANRKVDQLSSLAIPKPPTEQPLPPTQPGEEAEQRVAMPL